MFFFFFLFGQHFEIRLGNKGIFSPIALRKTEIRKTKNV